MSAPMVLGGRVVEPGEAVDIELPVSQRYDGGEVTMPLRVVRAARRGPTVMVSGAVHGDELNGTGIVREILLHPPFELIKGTLILVPVVNILGFERGSRYLPDRRDLNRCFPGSATGSLAKRVADAVFTGVVEHADWVIDLHTGSAGRTNFPNVRADLRHAPTARMAKAFGCELIFDHQAAEGTLRRAVVDAGRAAILLEAGEVLKVEPSVVEVGVRGIQNVLIELGMVAGKRQAPSYQVVLERSRWLRAERGGMLRFHALPGDPVDAGAPIATCATLLGRTLHTITAPEDGVVIGITTMPSVKPGDPVAHLAVPSRSVATIRRAQAKLSDESLHERMRDDLAANVRVDEVDV